MANVNVVPVTDGAGNSALQGTVTFTPTVGETFYATYSGDSNYISGNTNTVGVVVTGTDFSMTLSTPTVTIPRGNSGFDNIVIVGQSGYSGPLNFTNSSCSGLPAESTCAFSPTSLTGSGTIQVTIATTLPHAALRPWHFPRNFEAMASLGFLVWVLISGSSPRRQHVLSLLLISSLLTLSACGGGSTTSSTPQIIDLGTPRGSYTVIVTATAGGFTHSVSFNLVVD